MTLPGGFVSLMFVSLMPIHKWGVKCQNQGDIVIQMFTCSAATAAHCHLREGQPDVDHVIPYL
jgi:hypothetical protein